MRSSSISFHCWKGNGKGGCLTIVKVLFAMTLYVLADKLLLIADFKFF